MAATTLAATSAMANSSRHYSAGPAAQEQYVRGNDDDAGYGINAAVPDGNVMGMPGVISYDRYAGWDPNPAIRLMLMRDPNGGDSQ